LSAVEPAAGRTIRSLARPLVALASIALVFRVQVIAIGPLLPTIQDGLDISHGVAGALSAIPVLCMGIFAPLAPALARVLGARWALAACAGLVIAFGLLRLAVPGPILVLALTFGVGLGMGLAGPIFPLVVRHETPARPALGTGAYAIGLVLGATIAAAVAVPLAGEGGDWRLSLGIITLAGLGSLAVWLGLAPPDETVDSTLTPPRIPWRSPIAWVLGILFALQSMLYYGVVTWLADVYVERGWSGPASANLVALFGAVTLVGTTVMPLGADRIGTRRGQLVASSLLVLVGLLGVVAVPDQGVVWAIALGAGMGAIFPIVLTLPVDVGGRPADVAATAALMLLVGYILSAIAPLAFGIARDLTGDFGVSLGLLIAMAVALVGLCAVLTPDRLHRIGSASRPASPPGAGSRRSAPRS
jgi:CP family cyanate transporter-like MFS transporter